MRFAYEDLSSEQFEDVVVAICQFLLGAGVQGFAAGPDGGRDAKFVGTAQLFPSTTAPWTGTVIAQAKHTNGYNKSFSDSDFYSDSSLETVIGKELPRIKRLRANKGLDHYLIASNRRLTGNAESKLRSIIATQCGLPESSVYLCGVEQIEVWLRRFPHAVTIAKVDPIDSPLIVNSDELATIVEHLAQHLENAPAAPVLPTDRVSYVEKNMINGMTPDYARELRRRYLKETNQVKQFLAAPENATLLKQYESAADEFQLKVIAKRKDYQSFDEVINYIIDLLLARDPILRAHKRLTRAMVFYMYWNCDVGLNHDPAPK
jgi:hypothetical protein